MWGENYAKNKATRNDKSKDSITTPFQHTNIDRPPVSEEENPNDEWEVGDVEHGPDVVEVGEEFVGGDSHQVSN